MSESVEWSVLRSDGFPQRTAKTYVSSDTKWKTISRDEYGRWDFAVAAGSLMLDPNRPRFEDDEYGAW